VYVSGQWYPTSAYYSGHVLSISSSPGAVCLLTTKGLSVYDTATRNWRAIREFSLGGKHEIIGGNGMMIVVINDELGRITADGGETWLDFYPLGTYNQWTGLKDDVPVVFDEHQRMYYSRNKGQDWEFGPTWTYIEYFASPCIVADTLFTIISITLNYEKFYKSVYADGHFQEWEFIRNFAINEVHHDLIFLNGTFFAATAFGIKYSVNMGLDWSILGGYNFGLTQNVRTDGENIYALQYDPSGNGIKKCRLSDTSWSTLLPGKQATEGEYIGSCDGYFCAALGSFYNSRLMTWSDSAWKPPPALRLGDAVTGVPTVCHAGEIGFTSSKGADQSQVYWTDDKEQTWNPCRFNKQWFLYDAIGVGDEYLIAGSPGVGKVDLSADTIFKSNGLDGRIAFTLESSGGTLFAGTDNGVYFSVNGGSDWALAGLQGKKVFSLHVWKDTLYAGTDQGLLCSVDGMEWDGTTCPGNTIIDIASSNDCFMVAAGTGIIKRDFAGGRWIPAGIEQVGTDVTNLVTMGRRFIAGTARGTVLYSDDQGMTWQDISNPKFSEITGLDILGEDLFASDRKRGVYKYTFSMPGAVDLLKPHPFKVYPNPAGDRLTFSLPGAFHAEWVLEIFNMAGQIVKTMKPGISADGICTVDIADLPNGTYLLVVAKGKERFSSVFTKTE